MAYSSDLVAGKLDTKLACIAVEVGGKRAPVYSMVATQVNVQAPQLDATGQLNVQVIPNPGAANELRSDVKTVTVQAVAPGLFTADGKTVSGRNASKELKILGLETAAAPGDIVTLYGTGFGPTNPAWGTGEFPNQISPLGGQLHRNHGRRDHTGRRCAVCRRLRRRAGILSVQPEGAGHAA